MNTERTPVAPEARYPSCPKPDQVKVEPGPTQWGDVADYISLTILIEKSKADNRDRTFWATPIGTLVRMEYARFEALNRLMQTTLGEKLIDRMKEIGLGYDLPDSAR